MKAAPARKAFHPGERALVTGIYEVVHQMKHRKRHKLLLQNGDLFPPCRVCKREVRFHLVQAAEIVSRDSDFAGPIATMIERLT
jgi:hypothetical protein